MTQRSPSKKTKLELTWPGKEERPKLEPRILIEDPDKSYRAEGPTDGQGGSQGPGTFDNMLIKGDNLLALKALEAEYAGKVKCVFIDPPYNTGSAFEHYDDGLEHSIWLSLMKDRLQVIRHLLSEDGTVWITIDANEAHYLKVLGDEIFGRRNFIANVVWQKRTSPEARLRLGTAHDDVIVFSKNRDAVGLNLLPLTGDKAERFKNPDNDPRGPWASSDFTAQGWRPNQMYTITSPAGVEFEPPPGRCWGNIEPNYLKLREDNRMWFGKEGKSRPRVKTFLSEQEGISAWTWWPNAEVGHNQEAKKESIALFGKAAFSTPKPERLLSRIIELATNPGDLVLDSFAGSGTTGAVAQKMGRRWIMVEIGDHADTHIVPRLRKVIDGEDQGGISKAVEWQGGGGFRYYTLAPSLLEKDKWGNWVVARQYDPNMLAAAMCKHLGFTYAPSEDEGEWWRHGQSSETDFLYVTTQSLTRDALKLLSDEVGEGRSLMICAPAFSGSFDDFENLSCTKIPSAILSRCEWGRDDYSLNVDDAMPDDGGEEPVEEGEEA